MTQLPPSPFLDADNRFVLNVQAFVAALQDERAPKFLSNPSPEYLSAVELMPLCEVLTQFVRAA